MSTQRREPFSRLRIPSLWMPILIISSACRLPAMTSSDWSPSYENTIIFCAFGCAADQDLYGVMT